MELSSRVTAFLVASAMGVIFLGGCKSDSNPTGLTSIASVQIDTFTITNSQWLYSASYVLFTDSATPTATVWRTRYYDRIDRTITPGLLDTGMVLAFMIPSHNAHQWVQLPLHFPSAASKFSYNFAAETCVGQTRLHIFFSKIDPAVTLPNLSTYSFSWYRFKVVKFTAMLAKRLRASGVNLADHDAVMRVIGE